jgi:hypothetical protein
VYQPEKSVVAEHSINLGHWTQLQNTIILAKPMRQVNQILREVTEIELHADSINREDNFFMSQAWKPLICELKRQRESYTKELTPFDGT